MRTPVDKRKLLIHLSFWLVYGTILFGWNYNLSNEATFAAAFASKILLLHGAVFYLNSLILLPKLLGSKRQILYFISVFIVMISLAFLARYFDSIFELDMRDYFNRDRPGFRTRFNDIPPKRPEGFRLDPKFIIDLISSAAVLFISTIVWVNTQARKQEMAAATLKNESLDNELKLLKTQINPHFLFNALNNIYSISLTEEEKTPNLIMKLSEMLRYVLYECNEPKVTLRKEIDYIKNYCEFQDLKLGESNTSFSSIVHNENILIEPMLFISFVENCFKHGNIEKSGSWITIELHSSESEIQFRTSNSKPERDYKKDIHSGIGVRNVRKRLELLYPNRFSLDIKETSTQFDVNLTINI